MTRWLAALMLVGSCFVAGPAHATDGCSPASAPPVLSDEPGSFSLCEYSQDGLSRTAWVYQPTSWHGEAVPVVVVLHGCTQQGPDIAYISRFDRLAEQRDFVVVYPNQADYAMTGPASFDGNGSHCWNWFLPQGQERGSGEPALIAGLTEQAVAGWNGDRSHVYVIGLSAGAITAGIMGATYPDVYAAIGVVAGCEYKGLPCLGGASVQPPQVSGQMAYEASQGRARVVPFLVENGDADPVVPVPNAVETVQQWQVTDDLAAHGGTASFTVPPPPCDHRTEVPSQLVDTSQTPPTVENLYDVYSYTQDGDCGDLGELWIVHGQLHEWPGGAPRRTDELYTNPGGPDITTAAYDFFMQHSL